MIVTAALGLYLHGVFHGAVGKPIDTITDFSELVVGLRDLEIDGLLYALGSGFIKISFSLTLLRVLRHRGQRWVVFISITVVCVVTCIYFFFYLFKCAPVAYAWELLTDPYVIMQFLGNDPAKMGLKPKGQCVSFIIQRNMIFAHSGMMVAVDITLGVILPYLVLRGLNMKKGLKITAGILLGLGSVASVATMIRLKFVNELTSINGVNAANSLFVWSDFEWALCVIATSCATYKPLIVKLSSGSETGQSRGNQYSYGTEVSSRAKSMRKFRSWLNGAGPLTTDLEMMSADHEDAERVWHGQQPNGEHSGEQSVTEPREESVISHADQPGWVDNFDWFNINATPPIPAPHHAVTPSP